jgi:glutathione S-transferase
LNQPTAEPRALELEARPAARWFGGGPLPPVMDYLESQLPEDGDHVLARFSIADVALGVHLGWPGAAGLALDARRWPRTARYYTALKERPSFKTALAAQA